MCLFSESLTKSSAPLTSPILSLANTAAASLSGSFTFWLIHSLEAFESVLAVHAGAFDSTGEVDAVEDSGLISRRDRFFSLAIASRLAGPEGRLAPSQGDSWSSLAVDSFESASRTLRIWRRWCPRWMLCIVEWQAIDRLVTPSNSGIGDRLVRSGVEVLRRGRTARWKQALHENI